MVLKKIFNEIVAAFMTVHLNRFLQVGENFVVVEWNINVLSCICFSVYLLLSQSI